MIKLKNGIRVINLNNLARFAAILEALSVGKSEDRYRIEEQL